MVLAGAVVNKYGSRNDGSWRDADVALDHRLHFIAGQDLQCRSLGRSGQRMLVFAHVKRPIRALTTPVLTAGMRDSQDMSLGERAVQLRAAVSAGAKADQLVGVTHIWPAIV